MARTKTLRLAFDPYQQIFFSIYELSTGNFTEVSLFPNTYFSVVENEYLFDLDLIFSDFLDVGAVTFNHLGIPPSNVVGFNYNSATIVDFTDLCYFYDRSTIALFSDVVGGSVDFTPILSAIANVQNRVDMIPDLETVGAIVSSSLSALDSVELNNLHEDIVTLGSQLSTVTVPLQSLNGSGSEFMDGVSVNVSGRTIPYIVSRSYLSLMNTDTYTMVYDLVAADGSKVTCPESFLTPYSLPVVTP